MIALEDTYFSMAEKSNQVLEYILVTFSDICGNFYLIFGHSFFDYQLSVWIW